MGLTREKIAREIADVLELPYRGRRGRAFEAVQVVFKSIADGLCRGERVSVDGFGIFSVRTRPAMKRAAYYYPYLRVKHLHMEILQFPEKKYVHFEPSKHLLRMING